MARRSWSIDCSWSIERGALTVALTVALATVAAGCSGGKAVTLPENPPSVLRPVDYDTVYAVSEVDQKPKPRGGMRAIVQRVDYPDALEGTRMEGRVLVQFVVSPGGRSSNIEVEKEVVKRAHPVLEREARRVIMASPFKPGRLNGAPVPVQITVPIGFSTTQIRID